MYLIAFGKICFFEYLSYEKNNSESKNDCTQNTSVRYMRKNNGFVFGRWTIKKKQSKKAPTAPCKKQGVAARKINGLRCAYAICVITRCAETGSVPPARGVTVSASAFAAGFRTVKVEFSEVVVTIAIPTI